MTQLRRSDYKGISYQTVEIEHGAGVITLTLNNGAVNVLSGQMMKELTKLLKDLSTDQGIKVIIFESSNPDFFIAHVDINILDEQSILDELSQAAPENLNLSRRLAKC